MPIVKICLISNYSGQLDEGIGNIAFHLAQELSTHHDILHLRLVGWADLLPDRSFWRDIENFKPQIIHYVRGPSIQSLILMKILKSYSKGAKTVMSTTQPKFSSFSRSFIPLLKPNLVLTQSCETEAEFARYNCQTKFLPNGVHTRRFVPVSHDVKHTLRIKYGLPEQKFIILHVGHIKRGRNIQILSEMNREQDNQVLIVGSTSVPVEPDIFLSLKSGGCIVLDNFFEDIQELYNLSDCYIFPTIDKLNSIEMPLSVMEAMSCNLPVLTTRYGALPRVFAEGEGFYFAEKYEDFIHLLTKVQNDNEEIKTRGKVLPYSWQNISQRLGEIYHEVLNR
ncbi:glycosyltransferase family 4 protein [Chloroflexota bacterium]